MENKVVKIFIDGKEISAQEGQTILQAAEENGIDIPHLCYHPDLKVKANCRLCGVEIEGEKNVIMSCATKVKEGMKITSQSERLNQARKTNLELIFGQHQLKCATCPWGTHCNLLKMGRDYKAQITKFKNRKLKREIYQYWPIVFDGTKCIDCRNCVEACPVDYLEIKGKGSEIEIVPSEDKNKDCIYCGQCVVHCPVGAIEAESQFKLSKEKGKILVAQFAPSVRSAIGEEFGFPSGEDMTERMAAGLRKLGFDRVYDTSSGADLTTVIEAEELIERFKEKGTLPMFTSCCPAWVKFIEFYHPEFIPNLTSARSPHIMLGAIVKKYIAQKEKINIKDIIMVSVMPCTAKKFEASRPELLHHDVKPVDYVVTTRELVSLFKKNGIDLKTIKPEPADHPFADYTGAAVIYGASGGVMESALRTAAAIITNGKVIKCDFEEVRGIQGIKKAKVDVEGTEVRVAVVSGIRNAKIILEEVKKDPQAYHYIEFMACPGGCIGGGGQPVPLNDDVRKKRAAGLYKLDQGCDLRLSHKNPVVLNIQNTFSPEELKHMVHTSYSQKKKTIIVNLNN
jgi:NADH-quinone oxidoreductase subunit G